MNLEDTVLRRVADIAALSPEQVVRYLIDGELEELVTLLTLRETAKSVYGRASPETMSAHAAYAKRLFQVASFVHIRHEDNVAYASKAVAARVTRRKKLT